MARSPALPAVLGLALLVAGPAAGQRAPTGEVPRLQAEYRDEIARARRLRADAREAAAEVATLERRLGVLRAEIGEGDTALAAQRARLRELNAREAALTARLARERGRQGRMLTALQLMGRRPPPPLLVPASRAVDTVRAGILLKAATPAVEARVAVMVEEQAELARVRRLAVLSSEALITGESEQGDRRAELEALTARKAALETVLRAEAEGAERAARALEARIKALGGEVPTVEDRVRTASGRPAGGRLSAPVTGPPTERFGGRSAGWRWRADSTPAAAPVTGRVLHAGPLDHWGQVVILDAGPGWRVVVAGMDELSVAVGDRVSVGQPLGLTGPDGEIYLELRRDEHAVDPGPWLD